MQRPPTGLEPRTSLRRWRNNALIRDIARKAQSRRLSSYRESPGHHPFEEQRGAHINDHNAIASATKLLPGAEGRTELRSMKHDKNKMQGSWHLNVLERYEKKMASSGCGRKRLKSHSARPHSHASARANVNAELTPHRLPR